MTSLPERGATPPANPPSSSREEDAAVASSSSSAPEEPKKDSAVKQCKPSILSSVLTIFEGDQGTSSSAAAACGNRSPSHASVSYAWSRVLRRIVGDGSMWRFLGCAKVLSDGDVWFLGKCYKLSSEESSSGSDSESGHAAFLEDFSSRIWVTYRKGWFCSCLQNNVLARTINAV
jgi:cysteine protease ATG4